MLVESRNRVMRLFEAGDPATADVVAAVEADVALAVAVLRLANQVDGRARGRLRARSRRWRCFRCSTVHSIASRARTFDFFERTAVWQGDPGALPAARRGHPARGRSSGRELGYEARDRLMVTSLLHDIGKLVLVHAYPGYPAADPRRRPHARGAHPA